MPVSISEEVFRPDRLILARRDADLTREQLAIELDKSMTTVSRWEQGRTIPSSASVAELAHVLECTVGYLYGAEVVSKDPVVSRFAREVKRIADQAPPLSARQQAELRAIFRKLA